MYRPKYTALHHVRWTSANSLFLLTTQPCKHDASPPPPPRSVACSHIVILKLVHGCAADVCSGVAA
eukprot:49083-Eustigmatos_ZCMA.PRE.1